MRESESEVERFLNILKPLDEKLGHLFLQLPARFSPGDQFYLEKWLEKFSFECPLAVEVRHPDFYIGQAMHEFKHLLNSKGVERAIFDTKLLHQIRSDDPSIHAAQKKKPNLPVQWVATSKHPFLRYVGHNDLEPNKERLIELAKKVLTWIVQGRVPFVFIHSPDDITVPEIAKFFHDALIEVAEDHINPLPSFPGQMSLDHLFGTF